MSDRPSFQREIFCAAGTDVNAETPAGGKGRRRDKFGSPLLLDVGEKQFKFMFRQKRLLLEETEETVVVNNAMDRIILGNAAVNQPAIEPAVAIVSMAETKRRPNNACDDPIMNAS